MKITTTATAPFPGQLVGSLSAGKLYFLSFWTRGDGAQSGRYGIFADPGFVALINYTSTGVSGAAYTLVQPMPVAVPTGKTGLRVRFRSSAAAGVAYFDDSSLLECHADYIDVGDADIQLVWNITTPAAGTDPFGVILRRDGATMWLVQVTPGTAGTDLELIELDDGVPTQRASADVDPVAATSYPLQVSCDGQTINVYWDNALELTYGTATVGQANTQFGMWDSADGNATFEDVQIMEKSGYSGLDRYAF